MTVKKGKNSKVLNMVEEELLAIHKVKDTSVSIRKFNKIKDTVPKNSHIDKSK